MYDAFSEDYDRFVNWRERLGVEMPFIERLLHGMKDEASDSLRILDAACGTGMHAIALAQRGFVASGADFSPGMIERARANAAAANVRVRLEVARFGGLGQTFGEGGFDALLCLGNSLPHLLTDTELSETLADFAACLRSGGLLLIQNRNFDAVLSRRERWMEPQSHSEGAIQWVFLRFYDFDADGLLTFNLITLRQEGTSPWTRQVTATRLWPMRQTDLVPALKAGGFENMACYGSMAGTPFDPDSSGNLVIVAKRSGGEPGGSGSRSRLHTRSQKMRGVFVYTFTVPPEAIDVNGHVNNLEYLRWMQEVATRHSAAQGWPVERYLSTRTSWVVRSHHVEYLRPAFAGDSISLLTWVAGFGEHISPRKYLFWRASDQQVLVRAETAWVFVDVSTGRPRRIPAEFKDAFDVIADEENALQAVRTGHSENPGPPEHAG